MNCQCLLIPIIMIFVVLLFTNDNLINETFLGCPIVPNTDKINYLGPKKNFNVDEMCKEDDKYLSWKCYWRKNHSKPLVEGVGGNSLYNDMKNVGYHEQFKYDDVFNVCNQNN